MKDVRVFGTAWGGKRLSLRQQRGKARKNYSFLIEKILRAPLKEK